MHRLAQLVCGLLVVILAGFGVGTIYNATLAHAADASAAVDWKMVLPEADLVKLVDESAKALHEATKSSTNFNLKSKSAETEAYVLMLYAQAGQNSGNEELARKSAALQNAALKLAEAAKKKKLDEAQAQVAVIADFKNLKPDGSVKGGPLELKTAIPIHNLMEEVNDTNKDFIKYRRLNAAAFAAGTKPEEIALNSRKMAALTVAIGAHVPDKDTAKWIEPTEGVRSAALEMVAAAKSKKADAWKEAFKKMDASCTKCHEVFRTEE